MVKYSLQGKEAVITGAAVGIGYEIASQLLLAGASVILNDIDKSLADQAANKISATRGGGQCISVEGDAGEVQTVEKMIALAYEHFGRLDFAIANAGITRFGFFLNY